MTTVQIHGVTLSAHAWLNVTECFPAEPASAPSPRKWRDYAETESRKARDKARANKRARLDFFLNS